MLQMHTQLFGGPKLVRNYVCLCNVTQLYLGISFPCFIIFNLDHSESFFRILIFNLLF
jgi:hypothetical protein